MEIQLSDSQSVCYGWFLVSHPGAVLVENHGGTIHHPSARRRAARKGC